jgi:hypothetical protein
VNYQVGTTVKGGICGVAKGTGFIAKRLSNIYNISKISSSLIFNNYVLITV